MCQFHCVQVLVVVFALVATVDGWWFFRRGRRVSSRRGGSSSSSSSGSGSSTRSKIASTADKYIGSTKWAKWSYYSYKYYWGTNKCNIFVADVIKEAGGTVPQRHNDRWSPIGAGEWGNRYSTYLTADRCWKSVATPLIGDVIGDGVHVGIVTGTRLTTSATAKKVEKYDWGFQPRNKNMAYWRYVC